MKMIRRNGRAFKIGINRFVYLLKRLFAEFFCQRLSNLELFVLWQT